MIIMIITIITFITLILLAGSYGPLVWQFLNPPPGKIFLGSFGFPPDFFGNLTSFEEGRLGHWLHYPKLTSTLNPPPTFARFQYNLLGHLSRLLPFEGVISFHLFRFLFSLAFVFLTAFLIWKIFPHWFGRIAAFSLAFFASSFFSLKLINFWSPLGVFQRAAYYPHYLWSFTFLLLAFWWLYRALEEKKVSLLLLASFFGFLATFHPPVIISFYLTFPFYLLIFLFRQKPDFKNFLKEAGFLAVFVIVSSPFLFYLKSVGKIHPWDLLNRFDAEFNLVKIISLKDFLLGIGPVAFFSFIGGFLAIKKSSRLFWLLAPWAVVYILGFLFVWRILGGNSARFLQTPFFVFLGILSAFVLEKIWKPKEELPALFLLLAILLSALPAWRLSLKINLKNFTPAYGYIFSSPEKKEAFHWLKTHSQENQAVLSSPTNGMLIAAFAGNYPYLTIYIPKEEEYQEIWENMVFFLQKKWPEEKAKEFLEKEKIKFVWVDEEENTIAGGKFLPYSFLEKVFENPKVVIYKL